MLLSTDILPHRLSSVNAGSYQPALHAAVSVAGDAYRMLQQLGKAHTIWSCCELTGRGAAVRPWDKLILLVCDTAMQ